MWNTKLVSVDFLLQPLCGTDPMLVLEFSMLVLESCPTQTIELFLSGNIPSDLVNSYLKQYSPSMQGRYLELMLAMNENSISGNLQNEMVRVLDFVTLKKKNYDILVQDLNEKKDTNKFCMYLTVDIVDAGSGDYDMTADN